MRLRAATILVAAGLLAAGPNSIAQTAGAVRECDIMAETIHARSRKLDDPLASALATLYGALEERRHGALAVLAQLLGSGRFHATVARLRALVELGKGAHDDERAA